MNERVADVQNTEDTLTVQLMGRRIISVPLEWYPRLAHASAKVCAAWKTAGGGYRIHWPEIDEDLSTEGLLRGAPALRGRTE